MINYTELRVQIVSKPEKVGRDKQARYIEPAICAKGISCIIRKVIICFVDPFSIYRTFVAPTSKT